MMKNKIYIVLILVTIIACKTESKINRDTTLPFFNSAEFTPEWIYEASEEYADIHAIPAFKFVNQDGQAVTNKTYEGKIYIADFFFTSCPGICPRLAENMGKLQEAFKEDTDIMLLSHSVTPVKDSVSVLKEYAIENNVNSKKWNLVTGGKKEIYSIARQGYFADEDFVKTQDEDAFIHTENFILIDKKGRIRGVYNGTLAIEIDRIVRHIQLLKKEV
ncbi:MAG: protein SCO1/2 [Polaribacter sp.]|jgi:protein SCO1/2